MIKNVHDEMKDFLPEDIYNILKKIGAIGDRHDISVYVVGGFVRDLLLKRENHDMDVVVEADALEYAQYLAESLEASVKLHQRFKTAKVKLKNGFLLDIATARTESYEHPGALPMVESSSIKQDLFRRDFTINTLAVKLNRNNFGEIVDFFNAQKDIQSKKVRILHDLSFEDDPTRIFRAIRFEQRFDFQIDEHTEYLLKDAINQGMLNRLNKFRIEKELKQLLSEPHPLKAINRMKQLHMNYDLYIKKISRK
ncbi:MAG: CCA tRNA nucleotidyltransferase [PVC group bacterium]|nr:CCA tRNA nucleotidyltransferase [PVC group bacterium]